MLVSAAVLAPLAAAAQPAPSPSAAPDSFTVAECVRMARASSFEVQAATRERLAAGLDSTAAARNGRPSFAINGGAMVAPEWSYDPTVTDLGHYQLLLGMELPLLDGGARKRERAGAALAARRSAADRDLLARDAGLRAAAVALDLLQHGDEEAYARASLDWLERFASLIESGVRAGAHERADAVRVRIAADAVAAEISTLAEERGALTRELAQLMGRDPALPLRVVGPDSSALATPSESDSLQWLESGRQAPEVRAAEAEIASARLALDQARRKNAFTVDLAADAGIAGADLTHAVPEDLRLDNPDATFADRLWRDVGASVSLEFRRPILDPTATPSVRAREEALAAAEIRGSAIRIERRREILDLLGRWRAAAERLALARASVARADDHVLRLRSQYAGGASSLLEVLDAREQLDEARKRLVEARLATGVARWEGELRR
jgi:outer membrane protein TolC